MQRLAAKLAGMQQRILTCRVGSIIIQRQRFASVRPAFFVCFGHLIDAHSHRYADITANPRVCSTTMTSAISVTSDFAQLLPSPDTVAATTVQ